LSEKEGRGWLRKDGVRFDSLDDGERGNGTDLHYIPFLLIVAWIFSDAVGNTGLLLFFISSLAAF
jgi:hypothetical protein